MAQLMSTSLTDLTVDDLELLKEGVQMVKGYSTGIDHETVAYCLAMHRKIDAAIARVKVKDRKNAQLPRSR